MYSCDLESTPGLPLAPSDITLIVSRSTRTPLLINVLPLFVEENESIIVCLSTASDVYTKLNSTDVKIISEISFDLYWSIENESLVFVNNLFP